MRYKDGELFPTLELRRDITRMIRLKKPDVVVTLDPTRWYGARGINHPDHRAIGAATLEAVFPTARDRLNFIEHERDEGLDTHKVSTVYIAGAVEPNLTIDVTDAVERQIESLRAHKTQIADMEKMADNIRKRSLDPNSPPRIPAPHRALPHDQHEVMNRMTIDFMADAEALRSELIARRRDFHQHPELAFEEHRTAGIVADELNDLGLEVQTGIGKTGVVGILEGTADGPTVLYRADMDALPIQEENDTDYVSQRLRLDARLRT